MQLILTTSLGGNDFSLQANTLIETSTAEGQRLLEAGYARELLKNEPTELQTATKHVLSTDEASGELDDMTVDQLKDLAKQMQIEVKSKATKAELLAAIEAANASDSE